MAPIRENTYHDNNRLTAMQPTDGPEDQVMTTFQDTNYSVPNITNRSSQMMSFVDSIKVVLSIKFLDYHGRASRSEFWWFTLFSFVVGMGLGLLDGIILILADVPLDSILWSLSPFVTIFQLLVLIPSFCVTVRRLHDTGKTGWTMLVSLVPCVGIILLLVWTIEDGEAYENKYGPVPTNLL